MPSRYLLESGSPDGYLNESGSGVLLLESIRYWVGGTGTWDASDTTHWSSTSGGSAGASVPVSGIEVIFDANSFSAGSQTVTLSAAATFESMNWTGATNSPTFVVSGQTLNCGGSFTLISGMTYTTDATTAYTFNATSGTSVITTAGKLLAKLITFDGVGGTFQNADNCNTNNGTVTLTNGTWDINGKTIDLATFNSNNANSRTLTMGSGTMQSLKTWNVSSTMTLTANTGTITMNSSDVSFTSGGVANYNKVTMSGSGNATCQDAFTCVTFTRTGTAVKTDVLILSANITCSTSFVCNGNSLINRILVRSNGIGVARTVTSALFTVTNSDFQDFVAAGAGAPLTGTSIGDMGGNTSVTNTTPVTRYWMATSGGSWSVTTSWSATDGGATGASVPLCHDTVNITANSITSGSRTITIDMPRCGKDINFTGVLNNPALTITGNDTTSTGTVTFATGMTTTGTLTWNFQNRADVTFTSAAVSISFSFTYNMPGAKFTFGDDTTMAGASAAFITLQNGTLDSGSKNITTRGINVSADTAGITRTLNLGNGNTWTVTGLGVVGITSATSLTVNAGTSTIKATNTGTLTFGGAGFTFNNFWYSPGAGTGQITFTGNNTFNDIKDDGTAAHSILLTSGSTNTINTLTVRGSSGNLLTINGVTAGVAATIICNKGPLITDWLSLKDITFSGSAIWFAGANTTNTSGNTGMKFYGPVQNHINVNQATNVTTY